MDASYLLVELFSFFFSLSLYFQLYVGPKGIFKNLFAYLFARFIFLCFCYIDVINRILMFWAECSQGTFITLIQVHASLKNQFIRDNLTCADA